MGSLVRRCAVLAGAAALVAGSLVGTAATPVSAVPLASAVSGPVPARAAGPDHLYWADAGSGRIMESGLDGSGSHVLISGQQNPTGLAVTGSHVYWTNQTFPDGLVREANLDGSGIHTLVAGQEDPSRLTVAGHRLFWADNGVPGKPDTGTIKTADLSGGGVTTLVTGQNHPEGLAVRDGLVYWANENSGTIADHHISGGGVRVLATGQDRPEGVAVNDHNLFWANEHANGTIMAAHLDGSGATAIISGQNWPSGLALHGDHLYWTNRRAHTVMRSDLDGQHITTLATGQNEPEGIAIGPTAGPPATGCQIVNEETGARYSHLQTAVTAARAHDTLTVTGTCYGTTRIDKDLTIRGHRHHGATLNGERRGSVLSITSGTRVSLNRLTITDGSASQGGGIYMPFARVGLNDSHVIGNHTSGQGAGVYINNSGALTMHGSSTIADNRGTTATSQGGGIFNAGGHISLNEGSTIGPDNTAAQGGGIFTYLSTATVNLNDSSKVIDNRATSGNGGGIANFADGSVTMWGHSTVSGNTSTGNGGGIWNSTGGAPRLTMKGHSTVTKNHADGRGGGIWASSCSDLVGAVAGENVYTNTAGIAGDNIYPTHCG